jgi:hypothetical protein
VNEGVVSESTVTGGKTNVGGKTGTVNGEVVNTPEVVPEVQYTAKNEPIETFETTNGVRTPETVTTYDGKAGEWQFAGEVKKGAKINDLIQQLRNLTKANGIEYAVVKFKTGPHAGKRCIVSGNEHGIKFEAGEVEYIYMHSHPTNSGASGEDFLALYKLDQSQQTIIEPNGTVKIRKPTVNTEGNLVTEKGDVLNIPVSKNGPVEVMSPEVDAPSTEGGWPWKQTKLSVADLTKGGGNCKIWAKKIQDNIGGDIIEITGPFYIGEVYTKEGKLITSMFKEHFAVKKGELYYDRITGPEGMPTIEYMKLFKDAEVLTFKNIGTFK